MLISFAIRAFKPSFLKAFTVVKYTPPIALIKKLREDTGSPINECKIALETNEGDLDKAKEHLKAKGLSQAQKRLSKIAQEGVIGISYSEDRKFSVLLEINCETDFVARTDLFKGFTLRLLESIAKNKRSLNLADVGGDETKNQEGINDFISKSQLNLEQPLFPEDVSSQNLTILDTQKLVISKLQENVKIRRILTCSQENPGVIGAYVHNSETDNIGNSACMLNLDCDIPEKDDSGQQIIEIADNLAMQILGTRPRFLYRKNLPNDILEVEKNRIKKEMEKTLIGKPEKVIEMIIEGKLKKFYEDNVLMDMEYVLGVEDGENVNEYITKVEKNFGTKILLNQYHLWTLGQK